MNSFIELANGFAARWVELMGPAIVQSTVLAGLVCLLIVSLRRATPSFRFWLWMLVPLRLLIMPFLMVSLPLLPAEVVDEIPDNSAVVRAVEPESTPTEIDTTPAVTDTTAKTDTTTPVRAATAQPAAGGPTIWTWLMAAWILGVLFFLVRLVRGWLTIRRIVVGTTLVMDPKILTVVGDMSKHLRLRPVPQVLVTEENVSPFVFGLFRKFVVLPVTLTRDISDEELKAVLAHEFAHLRRWDPITGLLLALCEVFYFFHPVHYLAKTRLMFERETACDDCVIGLGGAGKGLYARSLVSTADRCGSARNPFPPVSVAAESFAHIAKRLKLLASDRKWTGRMSRAALLFLLAFTVFAIPGVALTPREIMVFVGVPPEAAIDGDGFESYTAGEYPHVKWTFRYNGISDPMHNKIVDTTACSGKNSLQLYGKHYGSWASDASMVLPAWKEAFIATVLVRPGNDAGGGVHKTEANVGLIYHYAEFMSSHSASIDFRDDETLIHGPKPGSVFANRLTYKPFDWHNVAFVHLPEHRRIFFLLDGRYIGSRNVPRLESPRYLGLSSGDGIAWFDDVKLTRVGSAAPYLEPLSFLTHEIREMLSSGSHALGKPVPLAIIPEQVQKIYDDAGEPIPAGLIAQCDKLKAERKWIAALGDVEVKVTDQRGRWVDKNGATLPGAAYVRNDLDSDGNNEVCILLSAIDPGSGMRTITVTNPDWAEARKYSLCYYDPVRELLTPICIDGVLEPGKSAEHSLNTPGE